MRTSSPSTARFVAVAVAGLAWLIEPAAAETGKGPGSSLHGGLVQTIAPVEKAPTIKPPPPILAPRARRSQEKLCVGTQTGPEGLGDTIALRQPQVVPKLSDRNRKALAAAYLSQDPQFAVRLLGLPQESVDPRLTYLFALSSVHVALRAGVDIRLLRTEIGRLQSLSKQARQEIPTSDAHFLAGLLDLREGRILQAFDRAERAIAREAVFLSGHLLRLEAALTQAQRVARDDRACVKNSLRVIGTLYDLTSLAPCPVPISFIDALLEFDPPVSRFTPELALARIYFAKIARNDSAAAPMFRLFGEAMERRAATPSCNETLWREVRSLEELSSPNGSKQ